MVMVMAIMASKMSSEEAKEMMLSIQLVLCLMKMEAFQTINQLEVEEVMKGLFGTVAKEMTLFGEAGILTEILYI